jgi:Lambda phage tail tape-measure protein (Tape_meas_lam_C)
LKNNHLAALKKQLELINSQSLSELVHSFDVIAKAADAAFEDLKSHWYTFGIGSEGAKHALNQFQVQYEALLAKGDDKGASDLLAGTLASAQKVLAFQKQYIANQLNANTGKGGDGTTTPDYSKFEEAKLALQKAGVSATENEVKAQQALVDTLNAQVSVQAKVNALKKAEGDNARTEQHTKLNELFDKELKYQFEKKDAESKNNQLILDGFDAETERTRQLEVALGLKSKDISLEEQLNALKNKQIRDASVLDSQIADRTAETERLKKIADDTKTPQAIDAYHASILEGIRLQTEATSKTMADAQAMGAVELQIANEVNKKKQELAARNEEAATHQSVINRLTAEGVDQQKRQNSELAIAEGRMTQRQADEEELASAQEKQKKELADINALIEAQDDIRTSLARKMLTGSITDVEQLQFDKAVKLQNQLSEKKIEITNRTNAEIAAANLKLANTQTAQFRKMFKDWTQLKDQFGGAFRQTISGMNQSLATFITTGQGDWRNFAASAIESFIQIGLQYAESELGMMVMHELFGTKKKTQNAANANSDAAAAAASTLADAPWPENIPASFAVLGVGEGYAADALALRGGVLPNREMMVHTHPEEMILPQNISNFIVKAASASGGDFGGGSHHQHMIFAPVIHAVDAQGVDRVLSKHMDVFTKKLSNEFRRRNVKV